MILWKRSYWFFSCKELKNKHDEKYSYCKKNINGKSFDEISEDNEVIENKIKKLL